MNAAMRLRSPRAAIATALALATVALYARTIGQGFLEFDDGVYVRDNPHVREGLNAASVRWALTAHLTFNATPDLDYWQPLTVLSRQLDVQLFGLDARGHHATNVLLQALCAALFFLVLEYMTRAPDGSTALGRSAFAAALWALHPLRVESVAWITERKDVLSGLFGIATLGAYTWYTRRPGPRRMALTSAAFALGLMAKPILITLPFVLLLLDYWPLRRIAPGAGWRAALRLVAEKLPLFALTIAVTAIGLQTQQRAGTLSTLAGEPAAVRFGSAVVDFARYAWKLVWPYPMALPQPFSPVWPPATVAACGVALAGFTAFAALQARRRPYLIVGWLWFLGTLVPVSGVVQAGKIPLTDRFAYITHMGLCVLLAWAVPSLLPERFRTARWLAPAAALALAAAGAATIGQLRHWRDSEAVFRHAVDVTDGNFVAHSNLASVLAGLGRSAEAEEHSARARALRPSLALNHRGSELAAQGRFEEAIAPLREAIRLDPALVEARSNLALVLSRLGRTAEARREYEEALRYRPRYADVLYNLALLDAGEGRRDASLARLDAALEGNPSLAAALSLRGRLRAEAGRFAEAESDLRAAARLRPESPDAHNNLGRILSLRGRPAEARAAYEEALRLDPGYRLARENLAELGVR